MLAPPPSMLPGLVLLSAVTPTLLYVADNELVTVVLSSPICTGPRCFAAFAAVPVTCANGSCVNGAAVFSIRYLCPWAVLTVNCPAVVGATTVAPVLASITSTDCPDHGLRTAIAALPPASSTTVTGTPPRTCTSTLLLFCTETVPSPS